MWTDRRIKPVFQWKAPLNTNKHKNPHQTHPRHWSGIHRWREDAKRSREGSRVADKDFSWVIGCRWQWQSMSYWQEGPQMEQQPSVRTEQRRSQAAKDSPPFLGSHTRMCSSKSNTGSQESSHSGAQQIETPAHGMQRTAGRRRFPGGGCQEKGTQQKRGSDWEAGGGRGQRKCIQ